MILFQIACVLFLSFSQAGVPFLTLAPGARALGMGSAFTAIADDATASYYNPAGLAFQDNISFASMNSVFLPGIGQVFYQEVFDREVPRGPSLDFFYPGVRHLYFGGTYSISNAHSLGFGYSYFTHGMAVAYDEDGMVLDTFERYDYAVIISYGGRAHKNLGIGISLKLIGSFRYPSWVAEEIYGMEGGSVGMIAADAGLLYRAGESGFSLGLDFQNLGKGRLDYGVFGNRDPLPLLYRVGAAYSRVFPGKIPHVHDRTRITLSVDHVSDLVGPINEHWWCAGGEITLNDILAVRAGYFIGGQNIPPGMTGGCGLKLGAVTADIGVGKSIYYIDYSYWRFQIGIESLTWIDGAPEPAIAGISSAIIPGAGQFYNGEGVKGILMSLAAFKLGEMCYGSRDQGVLFLNTKNVLLTVVHLASIADAINTAKSKKQAFSN
jgi:hypothetical protein